MITLPTTRITSLDNTTGVKSFGITTDDFIWLIANDNSNVSGVIIGGQTKNVTLDLGVWVEDRTLNPNTDSPREGWWGFKPVPSHMVPSDLNISQATIYTADKTILTIDDLTSFDVTWGSLHYDTKDVVWSFKIIDLSTGTLVLSGEISGSNITENDTFKFSVSGGLAAGTYGIYVYRSLVTNQYLGFPSDYLSITAQSTIPTQYKWIHPVYGPMLFDPYYVIGAEPYDNTQADQKFLLDLLASNKLNGLLTKRKEWINFYTRFNSDGTYFTYNGEYSTLILFVSNGVNSLLSLDSYHINATPGTYLWIYESLTLSEWKLDPRLRSVEALFNDPDTNDLWIGGLWSTPNGPQPFLGKWDGALSEKDSGMSIVEVPLCICARQNSNSINSIIKDNGVIYALTPCDKFTLYANKLEASSPGGRSMVLSRESGGSQSYYYVTEIDFATNKLFPDALAYILEADNERALHGVSKLLNSSLVNWNGKVWALNETTNDGNAISTQSLAERLKNTQSICYLEGSTLVPIKSWLVETFDASRFTNTGKYLLLFGFDGSNAPKAMRVSGAPNSLRVDTNLSIDNKVWRSEGKYLIGPTNVNEDITGWYVSTTDGAPKKSCGTWNVISGSYNFVVSDLEAAGFIVANLPLYLVWNDTNKYFDQSNTLPTGGIYLTQSLVGTLIPLVEYTPNTTLPYDPTTLGRMCFELGSGGTVILLPIIPIPTCLDASCLLFISDHVEIFKYEVAESGLVSSIIIGDPDNFQLGKAINLAYPNIALRIDVPDSETVAISGSDFSEGSDNFTLLQTFDIVNVPYGIQYQLPIPATKNIYMVWFMPTEIDVPGRKATLLLQPVS